MTQHPSLKGGQKGSKFRAVLKRFEKIKELVGKDKWKEEKDSVYRIPKIRIIKFKVKKTKAAGEEEAVADGAAPAEKGAAPAVKGAAPAGGAGKKEAKK